MPSIASQYNKVGKLLRFLRNLDGDALARLKAGYLWPPHVVFHITSRCQLPCPHCCYSNRDKNQSIAWDDILALLPALQRNGTRAIEHSGGEPTLYPRCAELVRIIADMGFKQGLITNGLKLAETLSPEDMAHCTWIRVSLDAITQGITIPHFQAPAATTVTASYVWGTQSDASTLGLAADWCNKQGVTCRVVPDVWLPFRAPQRDECRKTCESIGGPLYMVDRDAERQPPVQCLTAWLKPMIGWDSHVYPCCYGTTYEWNRKLPHAFRVCNMRDFEQFFTETPITDRLHRCSNCLGWEENDLLAAAMADVEHEEFF